ncbi:MAG: UDP-N-acetylmuramoyl-L-alanine--D-glutamate ligase [Pseudoflavonifractor sp.]|nr:UDP-N-acetylmuramoyl-L-alanine--D-glutamate ligase [Alloprevotella sp.]MCM1117425.1 UDP-N-acetylmuramoyl-L-alanine--D-glutamate ligase [Pseudoflavonifractor sp.]
MHDKTDNKVPQDTVNHRRLVVLGGGESGVGAAILGKVKGMEVFLSDYGTIPPRYTAMLEAEGIEYEQGGHSMERILQADEVVKSPGIAPTLPVVKEIVAHGIPVISEIELAGRYTNAKMVCITGSNGKTTTTLLTYHILRQAGVNVGLAGNVGRSLALQVAREHHDVYVIELSSFQLENMYQFKANVAVILNITPDHLDRYDYKMDNYVAAKFRILNNLTPADAFIFWQDDPVIARQLERIATEARLFPFALDKEEGTRSFVDHEDESIVFDGAPGTSFRMPRADLSLSGLHNLYNSMAAGLSACILDIRKDDIRHALSDFEGVEHRLEYVATVDGARWINDSKATNVNSCWYALESMPEGRSTILILGGKDKGNDYSEILPLVRQKVKAIVCMGLHNEKLLDFFTGEVDHICSTASMADAVAACRSLAGEGDTVLLSPCCASFDLFKSYEHRGQLFKEAVKSLLPKS